METRIALVGAPGSGKTTIAREWGSKVLSFADPLRMEVGTAFGGAGRDIDHHIIAMQDVKLKDRYRPLLQAWGVLRRQLDEDYWMRIMDQTLSDVRMAKHRIAVDDCRFPNEYDMLRRRGFLFVRLEAGTTTRKQAPAVATHVSESFWPNFAADIVLSFEEGPTKQARRINEALVAGGYTQA